MRYTKTHLTLDQQVERLADRGLEVLDPAQARRSLEMVGYYRFSAYAYPFRVPIPPSGARETTVQYRTDRFVPGARFAWAEDLYEFDRDLRLLVLDAVETIEIAVRSKIGYHLGARHPFGHLSRDHLDAAKCDRPDAVDRAQTSYDAWRERFSAHLLKSSAEDFIDHHIQKYDGRLPIWAATEIMEFGQLVRLYGFMADADQSRISKELAGVSGAVFARWMKLANYARNISAHHARPWNRTLTYKLGRVPETVPELVHLNAATHCRSRAYAVCALLALLTQRIRPETRWTTRLRDVLHRFPEGLPVSPKTHMGFPDEWMSLHLWG